MITGMHAIVFSPQAEKVRAFFADVTTTTDSPARAWRRTARTTLRY